MGSLTFFKYRGSWDHHQVRNSLKFDCDLRKKRPLKQEGANGHPIKSLPRFLSAVDLNSKTNSEFVTCTAASLLSHFNRRALTLAFAERVKTDAQKAALLERRVALLHQIEKWRELQAMYMPGVLDVGVSKPGPSPREKAESVKLWLPSHLDATEQDSHCLGGVVASERELRFGQLHDALDDLRRARRTRRGLITFHNVQLSGEGQKTQTKSQSVMHTVQEWIDRSVQRYRVARDALLQLDPSGSWQKLYPVLNDRDNRGPGKEPEELPASDGQFAPSWIWLSTTNASVGDPTLNTISPDEVNEDMRVEWAQSVARAEHWEEEVVLLREEIRRVVHFLEWKSRDWVLKASARAGAVPPKVFSGLSAYAHKQASVYRNLAITFCWRWRSTLISLDLPHDWATEFLKTQGVPLVNPDSKKRKVRCKDDNNDNFSDDSDTNSSEFDESEHEGFSE